MVILCCKDNGNSILNKIFCLLTTSVLKNISIPRVLKSLTLLLIHQIFPKEISSYPQLVWSTVWKQDEEESFGKMMCDTNAIKQVTDPM